MASPRMVFPGLEHAVVEMSTLARMGQLSQLTAADQWRLTLLLRYLHAELVHLVTASVQVGRAVETYVAWAAEADRAGAETPPPVEELVTTLDVLLDQLTAASTEASTTLTAVR